MGECREMLLRHGVKISYAKSKRGVAIAEHDHQEYEKQVFRRQDAADFLLPLSERCRSWFGELDIDDERLCRALCAITLLPVKYV